MVAGSLPGQPQQHRPIRGVPHTGQRQRTVEVHLDPLDSISAGLVPPAHAQTGMAARIGPMVCELDGPTPILYRSKKLVVTAVIVAVGKYEGPETFGLLFFATPQCAAAMAVASTGSEPVEEEMTASR